MPSVLDELKAIIERHPEEIPALLERQPDEPDTPDYELLCKGPPYYVVRVPIPGRPGQIWASRQPGLWPSTTDAELSALTELGVSRIVCLVDNDQLLGRHGAHRYLNAARARWKERFHHIHIEDHKIPPSDEAFEACVETIDDALHAGEQILIHCIGGCGRTGTFVSCLLIRAGLGPRDAIRAFRLKRRCGPETLDQLAYVYRYAHRHAPEPPEPSAEPPEPREPTEASAEVRRLHFTHHQGERVLIARGGLSAVYFGRAHFTDGGRRRVAIKVPHKPFTDTQAEATQHCIRRLREAGVRLPRMFLHHLEGAWVIASPLFGGTERGTRCSQPSRFYQEPAFPERRFALDQLIRVANTGYWPSLDLFLLLHTDPLGLLPIDLDLVVQHRPVLDRARKLAIAIVQLGVDAEERALLREDARQQVKAELRQALEGFIGEHGSMSSYLRLA